jgi:DNA adenine methylase
MKRPDKILETALTAAKRHMNRRFVSDAGFAGRIERVVRCLSNRAPTRFLLACLLAKAVDAGIDIRKPYTEIGAKDAFSGRTYDERHVGPFIIRHSLPCNPTTAFLTPAFRNIDRVLTRDLELVGRPREVYNDVLTILDTVQVKRIAASDALQEILRLLLVVKAEKSARLSSLLSELEGGKGSLPLSSEGIVTLIAQHLGCKHSSRLPVLVVAAAYRAAEERLGERVLALHSHNAADEQTGALGDLEITLENDDRVVTSYEMKTRRVTREDIERAVQKVAQHRGRIDNYLFVTTDVIEPDVAEFAASRYEETGGVEFVILDCLGFLRHFLHLFYRIRGDFLDRYQELVLREPESAVGQPLKEAFLALRKRTDISLASLPPSSADSVRNRLMRLWVST